MTDHADLQRSHRKTRDRAIALVLIGTALLLPPVAMIFRLDGTVAGLPIPLLYVFVVWVLLIAGAMILAPALRDGDEAIRAPEAPGRDR